jgi:hypothetical protein
LRARRLPLRQQSCYGVSLGQTFSVTIFFAVCIWPLAFIVAGIITQLLIGLTVNSGNNAAFGASKLMGMQYF